MKLKTLFNLLVFFISIFIFQAAAAAGENAPPRDNPAAPSENDGSAEFKEKVPGKDPFQTLVAPPPAVMPQGDDRKAPPVKPPAPAIEPLPIKVTFIVGSSHRKFATMCLNEKVYQMTDGDAEKSGLFRVIAVRDREVVIFDSRAQKERTVGLNDPDASNLE